MSVRKWTLATAAAMVLVAGTAAASASSDAPRQNAAQFRAAEVVAHGLFEAFQDVYGASATNSSSGPDLDRLVSAALAGTDLTPQAGGAFREHAESIVESVSNEKLGLTVDRVTAAIDGAATTEQRRDGAVAVSAEFLVTRHIAEHDVDWVELVRHEVVVSAEGTVEAVVVHDLESMIEAQSALRE